MLAQCRGVRIAETLAPLRVAAFLEEDVSLQSPRASVSFPVLFVWGRAAKSGLLRVGRGKDGTGPDFDSCPVTYCVALGQLVDLSRPRFPQLKMR